MRKTGAAYISPTGNKYGRITINDIYNTTKQRKKLADNSAVTEVVVQE